MMEVVWMAAMMVVVEVGLRTVGAEEMMPRMTTIEVAVMMVVRTVREMIILGWWKWRQWVGEDTRESGDVMVEAVVMVVGSTKVPGFGGCSNSRDGNDPRG